MISDIDKIVFGNPCNRDRMIMLHENYLDRIVPVMKTFSPPKNSSDVTAMELNQLVQHLNKIRPAADVLYDENLIKYIKDVYIKEGGDPANIAALCESVQNDVVPLITKLKFFFNRPRPSQLAYYYELKLYPEFSYFTNSPSYPSGHTTLTAITCEVLGNHYPETYKKMSRFMDRVADSRLHLGVHYPSDNNCSIILSKKVLANPEFKRRHKL